jgi:hypothetical protein
MNRNEVLQAIADRARAGSYLELGVEHGDTFFPLRIPHKVGLDPHFTFTWKFRAYWTLRYPANATARLYRMTSDAFFARPPARDRFDLIFIDGLHTAEQSFRDVQNSLELLAPQGVIVMHDCSPPNQAAAHPASSYAHAVSLRLPGWTGAWTGDVWKTICRLRATRSDLQVFVLDCDFGLGIITRGHPENRLAVDQDMLDRMGYTELAADRKALLNLKDPDFLADFLARL